MLTLIYNFLVLFLENVCQKWLGYQSVFSAINQFTLQDHIYSWFHVQTDIKFVFLGVNQDAVANLSVMY